MDSGGPLSTLPEQNTSTSSIGKNGSLGEISKRAGDRSRWVPGKVLLESIFEKETFPPRSVRLKLAAHLGVEARQVQVWFQNRRQKLKRDKQRTSAAAGTTTPPPSESASRTSCVSTPVKLTQIAPAANAYPSPAYTPAAHFAAPVPVPVRAPVPVRTGVAPKPG